MSTRKHQFLLEQGSNVWKLNVVNRSQRSSDFWCKATVTMRDNMGVCQVPVRGRRLYSGCKRNLVTCLGTSTLLDRWLANISHLSKDSRSNHLHSEIGDCLQQSIQKRWVQTANTVQVFLLLGFGQLNSTPGETPSSIQIHTYIRGGGTVAGPGKWVSQYSQFLEQGSFWKTVRTQKGQEVKKQHASISHRQWGSQLLVDNLVAESWEEYMQNALHLL